MQTPPDDNAAGALAAFDFDRATVERFRQTFPRARWDEDRRAWFVPGKTAEKRIARWRALEERAADVHADARGKDAFVFDPIISSYLEPGDDLVVRTPYSKTVVDRLRDVPFARWDADDRAWHVPYRSFDALRRQWPEVEAAARRNEPGERARRHAEAKGTEAFIAARRKAAERKRRRYPVAADDPPPIGRPVSTQTFGIVVFEGSAGELADDDAVPEFYPGIGRGSDLVWANWRPATLDDLVKAWPAREDPDDAERIRGWWQPTKPELVFARKAAKSRERRRGRR